jgi:hypothetical protein
LAVERANLAKAERRGSSYFRPESAAGHPRKLLKILGNKNENRFLTDL